MLFARQESVEAGTTTRTAKPFRFIASVAAAALALGGVVAGVAAPANAASAKDVSNVSLAWGFQLGADAWRIDTTGATPINPVPMAATTSQPEAYTKSSGFTLTGGKGTFDIATQAADLDFASQVRYYPQWSYGSMIADQPWIDFADFEYTSDGSRGSLTAELTWFKNSSSFLSTPVRVEVANFSIASTSAVGPVTTVVSATPDWVNAVPAGTYAAGYSDAWPKQLNDALLPKLSTQDINVYFHRTGATAGNNNKAPLPLALTVTNTTVTEATVTEIPKAGDTAASVSIAVKGEGFATTGVGVYVGLAEVGTFSATDASVYKGTKYVTAANLPGGKLDTTLTIAGADLDPTKSYAVYTLKAHGQAAADSSQTTETPVTIDYAALYPATVTEATVTEIPSTGSTAASISIAVKGENFATTNPGIYVGLAEVGTFSATDASVYKGTKFITPANLPGGKLDTTLTIAATDLDSSKDYAVYTLKAHGQAATDSSQTTETPVTIDYDALYPTAPEKIDTTSTVLVTSKTSYGKSVTAKASVSSGATGTVAFYVDGKGVGTAPLVDGKASKALSKSLTVGAHKVSVKFLGNSNFASSESSAKSLTVAQATASTVKISGKSFAKGSNPSVTITVGKLSNGSYYTGKVTLKNSAGKVVKTGTIKSSGKVTVKLSKQSKSLKLKATIGSTTVKSKSSTWTTIKVKG